MCVRACVRACVCISFLHYMSRFAVLSLLTSVRPTSFLSFTLTRALDLCRAYTAVTSSTLSLYSVVATIGRLSFCTRDDYHYQQQAYTGSLARTSQPRTLLPANDEPLCGWRVDTRVCNIEKERGIAESIKRSSRVLPCPRAAVVMSSPLLNARQCRCMPCRGHS
jgi:hypothetical protein